MNADELRELCTLTAELTRLRQNECKQLCIENFAPDLLGRLIAEALGRAKIGQNLRMKPPPYEP